MGGTEDWDMERLTWKKIDQVSVVGSPRAVLRRGPRIPSLTTRHLASRPAVATLLGRERPF